MKIGQIGAQLYTIRDYTKTPADVAKSMKKIREIGFEIVQVSAMGPIAEEELNKILDGEGLTCVVTHEPAQKILENPEECVERLNKLNCTYTAYPHPSGIEFKSIDDAKNLAAKLEKAGKVFADAGQVLLYHNHSIEFMKLGGKTILDTLYDDTDPRYLQGELDTYWVQMGGGCPVDWLHKLDKRNPVLHLKDFVVDSENHGVMTEIGNGNLNWKKILKAADDTGVEWAVIEQDRNWINNDPFEALKIGYTFLKDNICS